MSQPTSPYRIAPTLNTGGKSHNYLGSFIVLVFAFFSMGMMSRDTQETTTLPLVRADSTSEVLYPEGYRQWIRVKTAIIGPQSKAFKRFGGIHHIYANAKAMEGYKTGQFADGSTIVFDVLEALEQQGTIEEGQRRFVDVMVKDTKRFADTGGWGYEEFNGNSATERNIKTLASAECYQCHKKQESAGFVFSKYQH
jgi:Cytochrome P460